ncbi:hypothetical protein [Anianabacter salinae]|uniref:hypothetical protein n=1 Tax=Anianabacter salinae TaxID=2851023 RepID=UPI00225DFDE6|nr:hypothetical protein [Anianabacter salinae]MBV0910779.1 hypothetical protein [Anianabacter salinae]
MTDFLPKEVLEGLHAARKRDLRRTSRLSVRIGEDESYRVLKLWDTGFAVDREDAPKLRGLVDIYDGPRHLYQCLIVTSLEEGDEMHYEFKRNTQAVDSAPLDFERGENAPVALLPR